MDGFLSIYFQDIQFAGYYEHTRFFSRVATDETLTQIEEMGERKKELLILFISDKSSKMAILQMKQRGALTALVIFTLHHI